MSSLAPIQLALSKLGPLGTIDLVRRKYLKRARYKQMLREVPRSKAIAILKEHRMTGYSPAHDDSIIKIADAMLRDENTFFTFNYHTRGLERPWEYDPIQQKHWPPRHYTEQRLHARDTPRDVKITWEINRFKDAAILGQAALLTRDKNYAEETRRRLLSWIEENPFAQSINWASALEISIRLLSWTSTLLLLREAGFDIHTESTIQRSIYEQARYLAGDLSTDKVIPSNHLIGEAAGLFIISTLWDFPASRMYASIAQGILEKEIVRQTYDDGATRESSGWYHQFVTHFFDLVERVGQQHNMPMREAYRRRLAKMKSYLAAITVHGEATRIGDADDGWALWFAGDMNRWKTYLFGEEVTTAGPANEFFQTAQHVAGHHGKSFVFLRAGDFGMGGAGFSSHAHDDFLAPILHLADRSIVVDPGTFVYNGDPKNRAIFRDARSHNNLVIGDGTSARQKMNFGWREVRPPARITQFQKEDNRVVIAGTCDDWPHITRHIELRDSNASIKDIFAEDIATTCDWYFHLSPDWKLRSQVALEFVFDTAGATLRITFAGQLLSAKIDTYDYSPSYRVQVPATLLHLTGAGNRGTYEVNFALEHA